jgi:hypothetical protein
MTNGTFACTLVLSLSAGPGVLFAQIDQRDCSPNLFGVFNGTFDCPELIGEIAPRGWEVETPNEQGIGYRAEIRQHPARSSNVLWFKNTFLSNTSDQGFYGRLGVSQKDIPLGSTCAEQLVLRFDHLVTQDIPYEQALIVKFDFTSGASSAATTLTISSVREDQAAWLTSELYVDMPEGVTRTDDLECSVRFLSKPHLVDDGSCIPINQYPEVWIDSVEIRAIVDSDQVVQLADGQPQNCPLTCGGGASANIDLPGDIASIAFVAGSDEQDARSFLLRCPESRCCPQEPGDGPTPRQQADTQPWFYQPPSSVRLPACSGDLDGDGVVAAPDLSILLGSWGLSTGSDGSCLLADLDGDGVVGGTDLSIVIGNWGPCS